MCFGPACPPRMYHAESVQEDFLVLMGECILIIEDEERHLRAWDFVHCPPGTAHAFVGAGDGPCVVVCAGNRDLNDETFWRVSKRSDVALRHGASVERGHELGCRRRHAVARRLARRAPGELERAPVELQRDRLSLSRTVGETTAHRGSAARARAACRTRW